MKRNEWILPVACSFASFSVGLIAGLLFSKRKERKKEAVQTPNETEGLTGTKGEEYGDE